ncbi:MAG: hypothetical protein ACTSWN_13155 [Promethearchaeota archaeon]
MKSGNRTFHLEFDSILGKRSCAINSTFNFSPGFIVLGDSIRLFLLIYEKRRAVAGLFTLQQALVSFSLGR